MIQLRHSPAIEKLLIFGDSWPQGSELRHNQRPFGEVLASQLSVPCWNHSRPSTSIPHLILQLNGVTDPSRSWYKFEIKNSDAIFFLTSPDRDLIWDQTGYKELYLAPNHVEDNLAVQWYTKFHTPQLAEFRVNSTLLALQKLCEIHQIRDHYIWGWNRVDLWPEIDQTKFWRSGRSTVLDLFAENDAIQFNGLLHDYCNNRENRFVYPNGGHPNQRGHQLIADALRDWLAPCT